jgi:molybdenum cofactor synthesis domain-containing protein
VEPAKTAAMLVIGDEILSGKVEEANVAVLSRALRALGIELRRVVIVKDDVETIVREVRELSRSHDWLITSGGVGPTHDDVTIEAVARAFDVPVETSPLMERMLRDHYRERCTDGHLRMALIPHGASLEVTETVRWPTVRMGNTWVMPGIPVLAYRIGRSGSAFVTRAVFTRMDEGDLKPLLDAVVSTFPDVAVGSYPKWMDPAYKTKITFDGREERRVDAARDAFVSTLPAGEPQKIE